MVVEAACMTDLAPCLGATLLAVATSSNTPRPTLSPTSGQRLTLVHLSAQLQRFWWDNGCLGGMGIV